VIKAMTEESSSDAGRRRPSSGRFKQSRQRVETQVNVGGDARIVYPSPSGAGAGTDQPSRSPEEGMAAIEREFGFVGDLPQLHIEPLLQDQNPPDEQNHPSLIASRQPAFSSLDEYVERLMLEHDGHRCLFILGDAGMGKTSLLIMFKRRYLSASPPSNHDCALMRLGPDSLDRIRAARDPGRTILLLDSLDEDPLLSGANCTLYEPSPSVLHRHAPLPSLARPEHGVGRMQTTVGSMAGLLPQ